MLHYRDFLHNISINGFGVFSITMLSCPKNRRSLTEYINRNSDEFLSFSTGRGRTKLLTLSPLGHQKFGFKKNFREYTWQTMADISLYNSYMTQENSWVQLKNKPGFFIEINQMKVGIISLRFGIPVQLPELDVVLAHKDTIKRLQDDPQFTREFCRKSGLEHELVTQKMNELITPKALVELKTG